MEVGGVGVYMGLNLAGALDGVLRCIGRTLDDDGMTIERTGQDIFLYEVYKSN